jgi:hypothetical protein
MSKVLEYEPLPNMSTIVEALRGVFQGAEQEDWSAPTLQGIFGHAFNFNMKRGAGEVWQEDYLDYHGGFFETLPEIPQFRILLARQARKDGDFTSLKTEAWDAVRESIDRRIPAIAWQPMSCEQKAAGVRAGAWGLLVGYDGADETYAVRHQYHKGGQEAFTVRYDAIGHSDPSEWFCVLVYEGPADVDLGHIHIRALRNAIAFSEGTRSESADYREVSGRGLAAYELWLDAFETEDVSAEQSKIHAFKLTRYREHAKDYLHELVDIYPEAASELNQTAALYDREFSATNRLEDFCSASENEGGFTSKSRSEAHTILHEAMEAEHAATSKIKECLVVLTESK